MSTNDKSVGGGSPAQAPTDAAPTDAVAQPAAPTPKPVDVAALVEERLAAALAPIMERLGQQAAAEPAKIADPVVAAELEKSRKELAKLERQLAADKRAAHEATLRANLSAFLAKSGARPEAMDIVLDHVLKAKQAIQVDERGNVTATWNGAQYETPEDAMSAFLSTPQGAIFVQPPKAAAPAQPAKPTGFGNVARPASNGTPSVAERLAALRAAGYDV